MFNQIHVASGLFDKALGMLVPRNQQTLLVLIPCRSIHTFCMKSNLDVAFISKEGSVLFSERNVKAGRVIKQKKAVCVLERYSDVNMHWFEEGQQIRLSVE